MLTVPEAARRTGRNPETIRRWIRAGRLRSQRVGTQHLIDEGELQALVGDYSDYAGYTPPGGWGTFPDGTPAPDWARLVRQERDSH